MKALFASVLTLLIAVLIAVFGSDMLNISSGSNGDQAACSGYT